jgi:iron(III) transport system ATP-binding protein
MNTLSLSNVEVNFGDTTVLRGITLNVPPGSLVAIVGPSGCGKTTLLRTIAGLQRARTGDIRLGHRMLTTHGMHLVPEKRQIGWVPQDAALFPHLTVAENVAFGLGAGGGAEAGGSAVVGGAGGAGANAGRRGAGFWGAGFGGAGSRSLRQHARGERVATLLALVGLSDLAERSPAQLSGGQAQRVALARALAVSPQLVLLDEPFAALDPVLRAELRTEVRALLSAQGVTGILVTHDQSEALSVADYVAVMNGGEILQFGTPAAVYGRPASPWVANFVGDAVFLPGAWRGPIVSSGGSVTSDGSVTSVLGTVDADWVSDLSLPDDGTSVSLLVRPEQLILDTGTRSGDTSSASDGSRAGSDSSVGAGASATVNSVNYTGHDAVLGLLLDDGTVCESRVTAAGLLTVGTRVTVRIAGSCLAYPA